MNSYIFSGKRKEDGRWICGDLEHNGDLDIRISGYVVIPETIGWFIGLEDKEGEEIVIGDIIEFSNTDGQIFRKEVKWDSNLLCIMIGNMPYIKLFESGYIQPSKLVCKVIGNVYDNPELLEVTE